MAQLILGLAGWAAMSVGCSSGSRHQGRDPNRPTSRQVWYKVEAHESAPMVRNSEVTFDSSNAEFNNVPEQAKIWLKKALALEGFKFVEGPLGGAYVVSLSVQIEKPTLIGIGLLNPYYHQLILTFAKEGKTVWLGRVRGPSEYPDALSSTPQLLTVLRPYIGQSTGGVEKSLSMKEDDVRVLDLIAVAPAEPTVTEGSTATQ